MKNILVTILLAMPLAAMAQSEWEVPDAAKPAKEMKPAKEKERGASAPRGAAKERRMKIDARYGEGAVPEVEGKVEWQKTIACTGLDADKVYERTLTALTALTKEERQGAKSRISAVNRKQHIIAAYLDEEMVFSNTALAKDYTQFRYTLIAECRDREVTLRLGRISFEYEKGRAGGGVFTAEEWISDSEALNKTKTNFYRLNGKFRKKAIDRKDELFNSLELKIKG